MTEQASDDRERRWRLLGRACLLFTLAAMILTAKASLDSSTQWARQLPRSIPNPSGDWPPKPPPNEPTWEPLARWITAPWKARWLGMMEDTSFVGGRRPGSIVRQLPAETWRKRWESVPAQPFLELDLLPAEDGGFLAALLARRTLRLVRVGGRDQIDTWEVPLPETADTSSTVALLPAPRGGAAPVAVYFADGTNRVVGVRTDTGDRAWELSFALETSVGPEFRTGFTRRVVVEGHPLGWATRPNLPGYFLFDANGSVLYAQQGEFLFSVMRSVEGTQPPGLLLFSGSRWLHFGPEVFARGSAESPPKLEPVAMVPPFLLATAHFAWAGVTKAGVWDTTTALNESIINGTWGADDMSATLGYPKFPPAVETKAFERFVIGQLLSHEPVFGLPGKDMVLIKGGRELRFRPGSYSPKDKATLTRLRSWIARNDVPSSTTLEMREALRQVDPQWLASPETVRDGLAEISLPYRISAGRSLQDSEGHWILVLGGAGRFAELLFLPRDVVFAEAGAGS